MEEVGEKNSVVVKESENLNQTACELRKSVDLKKFPNRLNL